jgi:hypothetical protein
MDSPMQMVAICQLFGWTYNEYMEQPTWFLNLVREKLIKDAKEAELAQKS